MSFIRKNEWYTSAVHNIGSMTSLVSFRNCGDKKIFLSVQLHNVISGGFEAKYKVYIEYIFYDSENQEYITKNETLKEFNDVNEACDFYDSEYSNLYKYHKQNPRNWDVIKNSVIYDKLDDISPNQVDLYYVEKFTEYFEHEENIICYYTSSKNIAYVIDNTQKQMHITEEFVKQNILNDLDEFNVYLKAYCDYKDITYNELSDWMILHLEQMKHIKIFI